MEDYIVNYDRRVAIKEAMDFLVALSVGKLPQGLGDEAWKLGLRNLECLLNPPIFFNPKPPTD